MENKPQKRHKALQPLSREHHHGLLLSWKIKTGLNKGVELKRIRKYTNWFFQNHLIPHFKMEEEYIFSLLEDDNVLKIKALDDHAELNQLFSQTETIESVLRAIETALEKHIRFEERVLFPEIQKIATEKQFALIEAAHHCSEKFIDNYKDEFWL